MSNFNDKIAEYTGDGIPAYNRKINEIIRKLNWLMGMRSINGKPITESDQGPVFDLAPASSQGPNPWATDPLGNQAGWSKIKVFDPTGLMFFDLYAWTGALLAQEDAPWLFDPANNQAGWIVCPSNTFWGTGQCAAGPTCTNFENGNNVLSGGPPNNTTYVLTANPANAPIVPPSSCTPRFYLSPLPPSPAVSPSQPVLQVSANGGAIGWAGVTFNWTYSVTYDGTQILSASGSGVTQSPGAPAGSSANLLLNPAGWTFDPSGLPGYAHGNGYWIYQFNGAASSNTNPAVVQTFSWSNPSVAGLNLQPIDWNVVFMTG